MSFVCEGVTHCMKCAKVLKMDEIGMCKECEKPYMLGTTTRRYGKTVQQAINLIDQLDREMPLNKTYGIKRLSRGSFAIFGEEHISKINKAFDEDNKNILFEEIMESIKEQRKTLDRIEEIINS